MRHTMAALHIQQSRLSQVHDTAENCASIYSNINPELILGYIQRLVGLITNDSSVLVRNKHGETLAANED